MVIELAISGSDLHRWIVSAAAVKPPPIITNGIIWFESSGVWLLFGICMG